MSRKYTKKSSYWEERKAGIVNKGPQPITINTVPQEQQKFERQPIPNIDFGATYISDAETGTANCAVNGNVPSINIRGRQTNNLNSENIPFQNIQGMKLPWEIANGYYSSRDTIDLCARAYAGFAALRNAIEIAVEFSNLKLHVKSENKSVKKFFEEWFYAVQLNKLKEQYFREYYRSGNVFLYKFIGKFGPAYYKNFQQSFGAKNNKLPIRYSILNPVNIFVQSGLTAPYVYVRLLSTFEIERLKNPLTPQDKQVFDSLPDFIKKQITAANNFPQGIYIPIEPERLRFAFYKKQEYEPLATPMAWPVLPDIEWKLSMKKMDMSLARTLEHAILLVTNGETLTQWGGGINQNNLAKLQSLFSNETISRVLVADYTTKAEWLIPDIKDLLGPQKYEVVNKDIQEGLSSILAGNDKFATAQIKAKIFIKRLEAGQDLFLNDFLMPEIAQICEDMGFRTVPTVEFEKINLQDEAVMNRVYTQLAQLGILTADQTVEALETGILPDKDEMDSGQKEYKKSRDDGMYMPLVGGSSKDDGAASPAGRPSGTKGIKQSGKKPSPVGGTSRGAAFSISKITAHMKESEILLNEISKFLKKKFKVKELNEQQGKIVNSFAKIIINTNPKERWVESIAKTVENPVKISTEIAEELDEIALAYDVDDWMAGILRHSKTESIE